MKKLMLGLLMLCIASPLGAQTLPPRHQTPTAFLAWRDGIERSLRRIEDNQRNQQQAPQAPQHQACPESAELRAQIQMLNSQIQQMLQQQRDREMRESIKQERVPIGPMAPQQIAPTPIPIAQGQGPILHYHFYQPPGQSQPQQQQILPIVIPQQQLPINPPQQQLPIAPPQQILPIVIPQQIIPIQPPQQQLPIPKPPEQKLPIAPPVDPRLIPPVGYQRLTLVDPYANRPSVSTSRFFHK